MKKYNNFLLEKIGQKKLEYIDTIISYLNKHTNYLYARYKEEFVVLKPQSKYESILYLMVNRNDDSETKAIRFNFSNFGLYSIDMWEDFRFNLESGPVYNQPSYEMRVPSTILQILDDVVAFVEGEFSLYELNIEEEVKESPEEEVESELDGLENIDIDIFKAIKLNTLQVATNKKSPAFILSGLPGLGKTWDVTHTLDEANIEYQYFKGNSTPAGLYELLFKYRKELIVLDDMDDALSSKDTADMLKSVLDTGEKRVLDRRIKGYFDAVGLTDKEIETRYKKTGKLPNRFEFTGSIIFITNLKEEEFDSAVYTRVISLDVRLEKEAILNRIGSIMPHMMPEVSIEMKIETIELMTKLFNVYVEKAPLNLRSYYHCLNFRVSNEEPSGYKDSNGDDIPMWKLLMKKFLVRTMKLSDVVDKKKK